MAIFMEDIKSIVEEIYQKHNPDKTSTVPALLEKYKGNEGDLLLKISEKYKINLQDYFGIDYSQLITEIYRKFDPINIGSISELLKAYKCCEHQLLNELSIKYNSDFNDIVVSIYSSVLDRNNQPKISSFVSPSIAEAEILKSTKPPRKNSKSLLIGIVSLIFIIIIVLIMFLSGVFKSSKTSSNNTVTPTLANSSEISNNDENTNNSQTTTNISSQNSSSSATPGKFPQASERILNEQDFKGLSRQDMLIMKNEIYARHGYIFHLDKFCIDYFSNQTWYHGTETNMATVSANLTSIETQNIAIINNHELH